MITRTAIALALPGLLAFSGLAACTTAVEGETGLITVQPAQPEFESVYVSGHLGSYWDCPQDAMKADGAAGAADWAGEQGACQDPDNCPSFPMNCEHAEVVAQLTNTGEVDVVGLAVTDAVILGLDAGADVATEILDVNRTDGLPLATALAPGETIEVIVTFRGPGTVTAFAYSDMSRQVGYEVQLIFACDKASDELITPPLAVLPVIAT